MTEARSGQTLGGSCNAAARRRSAGQVPPSAPATAAPRAARSPVLGRLGTRHDADLTDGDLEPAPSRSRAWTGSAPATAIVVTKREDHPAPCSGHLGRPGRSGSATIPAPTFQRLRRASPAWPSRRISHRQHGGTGRPEVSYRVDSTLYRRPSRDPPRGRQSPAAGRERRRKLFRVWYRRLNDGTTARDTIDVQEINQIVPSIQPNVVSAKNGQGLPLGRHRAAHLLMWRMP